MNTHTIHPLIRQWLPALVSGGIAWIAFLWLGDTPLMRATGLSLVIVGVSLALRFMGAFFALVGGLSLTFSEAFWSQTGGGSAGLATITIAVIIAGVVLVGGGLISRKPTLALGIAVITFILLFWSQVGTPRSLRLTSLVTAWTMYLLIDMILRTNPRVDASNPQPQPLLAYHQYGLLLLYIIGVLNDSLLALLAPAIIIGLLLTKEKFSPFFWLILSIIIAIGIRGIFQDYSELPQYMINVKLWRHADRWIDLLQLLFSQFFVIGTFISAFGLARLSRWYPSLGTTLMIGYAAYGFFGLVYEGINREVLLLPLFIIQIIWITYGFHTFSAWLHKTFVHHVYLAQAIVAGIFAIIPLTMLWDILSNQ